jgi:BirA family biotin operon repressor/biotin-[acetyl-CoA-carboxylase] ligase
VSYRPLSEREINRGRSLETVGNRIVCLSTVGSTNDWVKAAAVEGAAEGLAVFAEVQTAGRGQVGRRWIAPPGTCLLLSILLRPRFSPGLLPYLTMLGACAMADAVVDVTGLSVRLKWPNDAITDRGKVGGALAETSIVDGAIEYAVLGIGLNVNLTRRALKEIPGATSLQAELGRSVNRNRLARSFLAGLDERYRLLRSGHPDAILTEWRDRLSTLGANVSLRTGDRVDGPYRADRVTDRGALVLERPDGSTFEILAGEVSVRPPGLTCSEESELASGTPARPS